eukprot:654592-Amphidinium_carterae.1
MSCAQYEEAIRRMHSTMEFVLEGESDSPFADLYVGEGLFQAPFGWVLLMRHLGETVLDERQKDTNLCCVNLSQLRREILFLDEKHLAHCDIRAFNVVCHKSSHDETPILRLIDLDECKSSPVDRACAKVDGYAPYPVVKPNFAPCQKNKLRRIRQWYTGYQLLSLMDFMGYTILQEYRTTMLAISNGQAVEAAAKGKLWSRALEQLET